ncbi:MAG: cyclic nucleotide-binding domain-containing protein [Lentisphaerae bacterium]|nr:cyclic nucleotide-binding domain-containing protein [Lentisphaerota bacterium]MBT4815711.1 cyclic nucleotide-binding domain-containing protein [Lentisphaerota bacterium]MBT5610283.1 cyclic nucleotide-binding domain-containing protein [Lentisphaerota bacterium]MBT7059185.1 cyclic nucleotide-binding domain-containing protein [Lentisphaerota bacterium]MBT7848203.1 cyclic nucleotide-binding domain-containing protein [Lentisphaerota bacterium]
MHDHSLNSVQLEIFPGLETKTLPDGTRLLKHPLCAEYLALTPAQQGVFDRFAGGRQVQEVLNDLLHVEERPPLREFYRLVIHAREQRFLREAGGEETTDQQAPAGTGVEWPFGWRLAVVLVAAAVCVPLGVAAIVKGMPSTPHSLGGWAIAVAQVCIVASLSNVLAGCALRGYGRTAYSPGISWRYGLPYFAIDGRDAFMGGRPCQIAVSLQMLVVPLGFAFVAWRLNLGGGLFAGALTTFILSSPFGRTPAHDLLHALFKKDYQLPQHAGTFLGKRLLKSLICRFQTLREQEYFYVYASYAVVWMGALLLFGAGLIHRQGTLLVDEVLFGPDPASRLLALLMLVLLAASLLIPIGYQLWLVARNLFSLLAPYVFRAELSLRGRWRRSSEQLSGEGLAQFLKRCLLFSDLSVEQLAQIADAMTYARVRSGKTIMREGDRGDCLAIVYSGRVSVTKEDESGREQEVAVLGERDVFGEIALLERVPRTATVRSLCRCELLVLEQTAFEQLLVDALGAGEIRTLIQICAFLRRHDLFSTWSDSAIQSFAHMFSFWAFEAGDCLVKENEPNDTFYIIYEGEVEVLQGGKQLAILSVGDFVGEISLLRGTPPVADVSALGRGRALKLGREDFLTFMSRDLRTGVGIESTLESRLAENEST